MISFRTQPLASRESFYDLLGRSLAGGLPLATSVEMASRHLPAVEREFLRRAARTGEPLARALAGRPWFPAAEALVLGAAEQAGRLDQALGTLAAELRREQGLLRSLRGQLAYPVLLLHLAPFVLFISQARSSPGLYLGQVLACLATGWGLVAALLLTHRRLARHPGYQRFLAGLPVVGALRVLARDREFLRQLGWLYGAGVPFPEAAEQAGRAVTEADHDGQVGRLIRQAKAGEDMASCLEQLQSLPPLLRLELAQAAQIGRLEDALHRVTALQAEQLERRQELALRGVGRGAYLLALVAVAWTALSVYGGYLSLLNP